MHSSLALGVASLTVSTSVSEGQGFMGKVELHFDPEIFSD